jgi:hypothetical protein
VIRIRDNARLNSCVGQRYLCALLLSITMAFSVKEEPNVGDEVPLWCSGIVCTIKVSLFPFAGSMKRLIGSVKPH